MSTLSISDLRYRFYGGNITDAEWAFLDAAYTAGVDASDLIKLQSGVPTHTDGYVLTWSNAGNQYVEAAGGGGGGGPTGPAGGDLTGTYPNPTIAAAAVTLAKMANLAANSIIGNNTGAPATPIALTVAQTKTLLAYTKSDVGLGSVDNTADSAKTLTGDVGGTLGATAIGAQKVTRAMEVNQAANSFRGNNTGSAATAIDLTVAQAKTLLALAVADVSGAAPTANATFTGTFVVPSAVITKANIVNAAANSFTGNNTGSPAAIIDMTVAQAKALLAITESDVANLVSDLAALAPIDNPTFTTLATAPGVAVSGLTGATAVPIRWVGGTNSAAAPTTGTFAFGDICVVSFGTSIFTLFICSVAGSPGTWVQFPTNMTVAGAITTSGGGLGFAVGNGGTVTQATSKATGVALNERCGEITMNAAALAANTTVSFTHTAALMTATDLLILNHASGGTAGAYALNAQVGAGSASINVRNITAGSLSEAIVIRYALIKGVLT